MMSRDNEIEYRLLPSSALNGQPYLSEEHNLSSTALNDSAALLTVRYVTSNYLLLPIALFGTAGNLIGAAVLCSQKSALTTTRILQILSLVDSLILVCAVLFYPMYRAAWVSSEFKCFLGLCVRPCLYWLRMMNTWLTVTLTYDRYVAVCKPLMAQFVCTLKRTNIYIINVTLASLAFCLPRYFESKNQYDSENRLRGNYPTELFKNEYYTIIYRISLFFLFQYLIPVVMMTVYNIHISLTLHKAYNYRSTFLTPTFRSGSTRTRRSTTISITSGRTTSMSDTDHIEMRQPVTARGPSIKVSSNQRVLKHRSITVTVTVIVLVCVACNLSAMAAHIAFSMEVLGFVSDSSKEFRSILSNVSNVLVVLNSAVNFIIYSLCSRNFRETCFRLFPGCSKNTTMTNISPTKRRPTLKEPDVKVHNNTDERMIFRVDVNIVPEKNSYICSRGTECSSVCNFS